MQVAQVARQVHWPTSALLHGNSVLALEALGAPPAMLVQTHLYSGRKYAALIQLPETTAKGWHALPWAGDGELWSETAV